MKKLRLNVEELTVETFVAADDGASARGTVKGFREYTAYCNTDEPECNTSVCGGSGDSCASDVYHCPESHDWDHGTCHAGSCFDSCDTFCAWTTPCFC